MENSTSAHNVGIDPEKAAAKTVEPKVVSNDAKDADKDESTAKPVEHTAAKEDAVANKSEKDAETDNSVTKSIDEAGLDNSVEQTNAKEDTAKKDQPDDATQEPQAAETLKSENNTSKDSTKPEIGPHDDSTSAGATKRKAEIKDAPEGESPPKKEKKDIEAKS